MCLATTTTTTSNSNSNSQSSMNFCSDAACSSCLPRPPSRCMDDSDEPIPFDDINFANIADSIIIQPDEEVAPTTTCRKAATIMIPSSLASFVVDDGNDGSKSFQGSTITASPPTKRTKTSQSKVVSTRPTSAVHITMSAASTSSSDDVVVVMPTNIPTAFASSSLPSSLLGKRATPGASESLREVQSEAIRLLHKKRKDKLARKLEDDISDLRTSIRINEAEVRKLQETIVKESPTTLKPNTISNSEKSAGESSTPTRSNNTVCSKASILATASRLSAISPLTTHDVLSMRPASNVAASRTLLRRVSEDALSMMESIVETSEEGEYYGEDHDDLSLGMPPLGVSHTSMVNNSSIADILPSPPKHSLSPTLLHMASKSKAHDANVIDLVLKTEGGIGSARRRAVILPTPGTMNKDWVYENEVALTDGNMKFHPSPFFAAATPRSNNNDRGSYPLHIALRNNASLSSVKILTGAEPSILLEKDGAEHGGRTPLATALASGTASAKTIRFLICSNANAARIPDDRYNWPLHIAVCAGCPPEVVGAVVVAFPGAVHLRNSNGRTPLDIAQTSRYYDKDRKSHSVINYLQKVSFDKMVVNDAF